MRRRLLLIGVLLAAASGCNDEGVPLAVAAGGLPRGTVRASLSVAGGDPDNLSFTPSTSAEGRFVAFATLATNLVTPNPDAAVNIFVRDLLLGTTTRVSVSSTGGNPNGSSFNPSISGDGRRVAFESDASNLLPADANGLRDIFLCDLETGVTTLVSVDAGGGGSDGIATNPSISATGRFVAFDSDATDLVPGDTNGFSDVFVRDLQTGVTLRASLDLTGGDPDAISLNPALSADGRYVAFESDATDLVPGVGNGFRGIYVRDLQLGTTIRVSVALDGGDANDFSLRPSISADGGQVAFESNASNLVPGDGNPFRDVFLRNLGSGVTTRISVSSLGGDPDEACAAASLSGNGRFVAFESAATNLVPGDGNTGFDIFLRDLGTGTTRRLSLSFTGGDPDGSSNHPSLASDGRTAAFQSEASNLVPGDGNNLTDIFVSPAAP